MRVSAWKQLFEGPIGRFSVHVYLLQQYGGYRVQFYPRGGSVEELVMVEASTYPELSASLLAKGMTRSEADEAVCQLGGAVPECFAFEHNGQRVEVQGSFAKGRFDVIGRSLDSVRLLRTANQESSGLTIYKPIDASTPDMLKVRIGERFKGHGEVNACAAR
jgi:hypothetical protein